MKTELKKSVKQMAKAGLLAGTLAGALMAPNVQAASGTTNVDITFPPLIILYYYNNIDITLSAAEMAVVTGLGSGCVDSAPGLSCDVGTTTFAAGSSLVGAGTVEVTATIGADAEPDSAFTGVISFDINDAWAVRALGTGTMLATVDSLSGTTLFDGTVTTDTPSPVPSLSLSATNIGDLQFDLDLADLAAGVTTASDDITITVVTP